MNRRARPATHTRLRQSPRTAGQDRQTHQVQPLPAWLQMQEARPPQRRRSYTLLFNMLWVLLGMLGGVMILAVYLYFGELLSPNSQSLGLNLGGLSTQKATALLEEHWTQSQIALEMSDGERVNVTPAQLGIVLDARGTTQALHQAGRTWDGLLTLLKPDQALALAPILRLDGEMAATGLAAIAPRFAVAPIDATVQVVDGRAATLPAQPGQQMEITATLARLAADPQRVVAERRLMPVVVAVEPTVHQADLEPVAAQINQLLSPPLRISLYDPITNEDHVWEVGTQTWSHWLLFDLQAADGSVFQWAVDPARVKRFLDQQVNTLGADRYLPLDTVVAAVTDAVRGGSYAAALRVNHRERTHTVQPGETLSSIGWHYGIPYPWIEQANPGSAERLWAGQELVIPSLDRLLPLPVVRDKRIIVSLKQQRMWAYEDGAPKWEWPVSTGIDSSPTSPGIFQIQSHEQIAYAGNWDLWMPYFMGIYEIAPGSNFMNGFHGFPTRDGHTLLWTGDLGRPVTYGCILISTDNAALLYNWAEAGVVVEVKE